MNNYTIFFNSLKFLRSKILTITLIVFICGLFGYYGNKFFFKKTYEANAQLVYSVKNTSSEDEVTAKTQLLKTYKRIILSGYNLLNTTNLINKQTKFEIKENELKKSLEISQEQDELVLNIKLKADTYQIAKERISIFTTSSIEMIQKFNNVNGEIHVVISNNKIRKPVSPNDKVTAIIGSMIGFIGSVVIMLILNQLKILGDKNGEHRI